jgi:hypothetical protein
LEELGYITAKNHYKGKLCIGRTITKGSSVKKHTIVPEVEEVSSLDSQEVVLEVEEVSSLENTTNTLTNSDIIIQETIQYTGEVKNSAMSMNQFLNSRYEELIFELVEKSSLGQDVFFYTEPANLDMFRAAVDEKEYNLVYPVLVNVIDIGRKLYELLKPFNCNILCKFKEMFRIKKIIFNFYSISFRGLATKSPSSVISAYLATIKLRSCRIWLKFLSTCK